MKKENASVKEIERGKDLKYQQIKQS